MYMYMYIIHCFSFRSGLSNSLYCPDFNDTKFDSEVVSLFVGRLSQFQNRMVFNHYMFLLFSPQLRDFISAWYIGQNTTVAGVGMSC